MPLLPGWAEPVCQWMMSRTASRDAPRDSSDQGLPNRGLLQLLVDQQVDKPLRLWSGSAH